MLANNRPATVPAAYRKPVSALLRDMGAVFNGADGRIPFRPDPLAHALRGGLGEEFVLIGATPAAGKTDLALNIALSVAANRKVVFMSLEIPATAVVRRALPCLSCSLDASVPATEHDFASIDGLPSDRAESCRSVVSHAATLLERVVVVDDRALDGPDDHSIEALANAIHAIALADGAPPVVVVDYVQLMGGLHPGFQRHGHRGPREPWPREDRSRRAHSRGRDSQPRQGRDLPLQLPAHVRPRHHTAAQDRALSRRWIPGRRHRG